MALASYLRACGCTTMPPDSSGSLPHARRARDGGHASTKNSDFRSRARALRRSGDRPSHRGDASTAASSNGGHVQRGSRFLASRHTQVHLRWTGRPFGAELRPSGSNVQRQTRFLGFRDLSLRLARTDQRSREFPHTVLQRMGSTDSPVERATTLVARERAGMGSKSIPSLRRPDYFRKIAGRSGESL